MAKHESKEDKIFQKFKTKIALEPEQVNSFVFFSGGVFRVQSPTSSYDKGSLLEWEFFTQMVC